jgi:Protein of unknown function (DUF1822)
MTYKQNRVEDFALSLPITQEALSIARQFASEQPNAEKAERVRLNTLAVLLVNSYLQMLGIATDLTSSDSWNPLIRLAADVADLEISGIGRLECRPIALSDSSCQIPPEVWDLRIGYVLVQIDSSLPKGLLLGFSPTAEKGELSIANLQSPEDLIDRLHDLKYGRDRVNLSQWLNNIFDLAWQSVENFLNPTALNPVFSFRSNDLSDRVDEERSSSEDVVKRAKLIDLGIQLADRNVVLVVELKTESTQQIEVCLQLHPTRDLIYLPAELELTVLDDSGAIFMQAQAREADNYIQLQFNGKPGEYFSVKVASDRASVTEDFAI